MITVPRKGMNMDPWISLLTDSILISRKILCALSSGSTKLFKLWSMLRRLYASQKNAVRRRLLIDCLWNFIKKEWKLKLASSSLHNEPKARFLAPVSLDSDNLFYAYEDDTIEFCLTLNVILQFGTLNISSSKYPQWKSKPPNLLRQILSASLPYQIIAQKRKMWSVKLWQTFSLWASIITAHFLLHDKKWSQEVRVICKNAFSFNYSTACS